MYQFSPKLPSHQGCHVTLNRVPCISLLLPTPNPCSCALSCPAHLPCKSIISFRVTGGGSHGGSQDFCADTCPLLHGDHQAFLSPPFLAGIKVALSIYGLHHNPKVWPNPEVQWPWKKGMGCSLHTNPSSCSCSVDWCEKFDPHCPSPIVLSAGVWPIPVCTRFYSTQPCLPALLRRVQVRPLYWGKQVSLVAPCCVWLSTFVRGACNSVLMCWCIEKEAWVSMYKKVFRAHHNDVDLLMSTRTDIISISVTDPKYPGFSSL